MSVRDSVAASTADSAALEDRVIPVGYIRSAAAQRWLDERDELIGANVD